MKTHGHLRKYLIQFFLEWEMCQTEVVEKIKRHALCSVTYLDKRAVYEKMWKNVIEQDRPQMTIDHGACAFILDKKACRHTLRICNTYCFSTETMVTRTCVIVTFTRTSTLPVLFCSTTARYVSSMILKKLNPWEMLGTHCREYVTNKLCVAGSMMYPVNCVQTFQRNLLPPSTADTDSNVILSS